MLTNIGLD